jgi:hypothetical protein
MPLTLRRGTVSAIFERHEGLVRLEVNGVPCVAYPRLTGPVALGDDVLVNAQARELRLGSGGFDVVHANLTRGLDLRSEPGAHVMKLPYAPIQHATAHGEEQHALPEHLDGLPVVACSLHSQLAPVCAALRGRRVAYVQLPGGALPVALSDTLRQLRSEGLIEVALAAGACFGGDVDCVNVHSALVVARAIGVDVAVCGIGPGIVGTGTRLGHGGMAAADAINAAVGLAGRAVLAVRVSERDPRDRHRGVSHHSAAVIAAVRAAVFVAWPADCPVVDDLSEVATVVAVDDWRDACWDLPLSHMGRGPSDDPWFFAAAFAPGRLAYDLSA